MNIHEERLTMDVQYWENKFLELKPYLTQVDARVGNFLVYTHDNIVSYAIRLYGEYCHAEVNTMSLFLNKESTYLDIGTNIGYHARAIYQQTGCKVLGFEPNPNHFLVAWYNCKDHPVQLMNAAVGNYTGKAKIKTFDPGQVENFGNISIVEDDGDEVDAITIDQLNLNSCDVMKIDVEGFEFEVLEGANTTIDKFNPVIFYEAQDTDIWPKCWGFLNEKDYIQYWVACRNDPIGETYRRPETSPFKDGGVLNIIAVPSNKPQPIELMKVFPDKTFKETATDPENAEKIKVF